MEGEHREDGGGSLIPPSARLARREVWVGLFTLFGLGSIFVALFTFTEPSTFRGRYHLSTVVPNAGGLRRGDPVELRGVAIGRVRGFEISPAGVAVRLEIENRYKVPRDAHVELASNALIGGAVAQIVGGESAEAAPPGAVLAGATMPRLPEKVSEVASQSQRTLERLEELLSDRTMSEVEGSLDQLHELLAILAQTAAAERADVDRIVRNLRAATEKARGVVSSPELERAVARLDTITADLERAAGAIERSSRSLDAVLARVERGEGTLGRLLRDDSLYRNANQAAVSLGRTAAEVRLLATDLRENPKRYVHLSLF